jgi:uncharacterized CHY-type Zn-finger protein
MENSKEYKLVPGTLCPVCKKLLTIEACISGEAICRYCGSSLESILIEHEERSEALGKKVIK